MIAPPRPHLPTTNPRRLLAERGAEAIADALGSTGYMIQRQLLDDFVQVLKSGKPWLIEGEAGSGKSAIAYALQHGCNMTLFPLQGMEELKLADILYSWDVEAQNQSVIQAVQSGALELKEAQRRQFSLDYLKLGEALHAFHWAAVTRTVPLLFFDEVDKLPVHLQDMLLQLCECGYSHVPRYDRAVGIYDAQTGTTDRELWPIVIFTSNNLRHKLSDPFRSRCYYSWTELPTLAEEVKVLHARVPDAPPALLLAVIKINESIKTVTGVQKKPGLRELIDLLGALTRDRVRHLDESVLRAYVGYLAKQKTHRKSLCDALAVVEQDLELRDDMLEELVWQAFENETSVLGWRHECIW